MDKDTTKDVMRPGYRDFLKGEKIRHIVSYSELTSSLQARIAETDPTERELLELIVLQVKQINLYLMAMSDENITGDDIEWP